MARLKIAYIGGGSTRGAGTMASLVHQGENFAGLRGRADRPRCPTGSTLVRTIAERMVAARGLDLRVTRDDRPARRASTRATRSSPATGPAASRRARSTSASRSRYDVIGQETHGPGGFFMALRSVHALQPILDDMARVCPRARIFNYTNPVNLVAQAVADHTDVPDRVALRGADRASRSYLATQVARSIPPASTARASASTTRRGACATATATRTSIELLRDAWEERRDDPKLRGSARAPAAARGARWARCRAGTSSTTTSSARSSPSCRRSRRRAPRTSSAGCPTTGSTTSEQARSDVARARPDALARRHPRARARDRLHGRDLQRPRRGPAGERGEPRLGAGPPRRPRGRDRGALRRRRHPRARRCRACRRTCAASSRRSPSTSSSPPTPRGRDRRRRRARARRASAGALARRRRAPVRRDGARAPRAPPGAPPAELTVRDRGPTRERHTGRRVSDGVEIVPDALRAGEVAAEAIAAAARDRRARGTARGARLPGGTHAAHDLRGARPARARSARSTSRGSRS